jgi:hypothetical protein
MADSVVTYGGQSNLSGDTRADYLTLFTGEVLQAFMEKNIFIKHNDVKTIQFGKQAQWIVSWKGSARYHTPGTEIVGDQTAFAQALIALDDLLIAARFASNFDEAMAQFDIRQPLAREMGMALARVYDQQIAQLFCLAARASAFVTGAPGGSQITLNNTTSYLADDLVAAIASAAVALDQKYVPDEGRFIAVRPADFYNLINSSSRAITTLYNQNAGSGSIQDGTLKQLFGMTIERSNNIPSTNVTTGPTNYQGNFSSTIAIVATSAAVGTVKLMELNMEAEYGTRWQGTLMVARYAVGHGVLRPECAVEIIT